MKAPCLPRGTFLKQCRVWQGGRDQLHLQSSPFWAGLQAAVLPSALVLLQSEKGFLTRQCLMEIDNLSHLLFSFEVLP
ncbi:hypothetical protein DV515_00005367 [Chloebia gouldiae]|uniref:Uncharacterized protein n=1 Tax=Chloebia gouldiae TaxID=44316 RepID=A0A3L8SPV9_CHLGU|nr:hypothetical protein DV515_00005367 [Chloebia gouldiae]